VQLEKPAQLGDRRRVVVDAQVDLGVVAAVATVGTYDDERGALPAAAVPAGLVTGSEGREQPLGQRIAGRRPGQPGPLHRVDDLGADEDVALDRVPVAGPPAGPVVAAAAGEGGAVTGRADDAGLPLVAAIVGSGEPVEHLVRRTALGEQLEAVRAVGEVGVGLGRDRADAGPRGGHHRPDRQEPRRDGDPDPVPLSSDD